MPERDHQAHIQRSDLSLWCGGTKPPTEVAVDGYHGELSVFVYPDDHSPHSGIVRAPIRTVPFTIGEGFTANPDSIADYALTALKSLTNVKN